MAMVFCAILAFFLLHRRCVGGVGGVGGVGRVGGVGGRWGGNNVQSMRAQRARAHVSIILYTVKACKCFWHEGKQNCFSRTKLKKRIQIKNVVFQPTSWKIEFCRGENGIYVKHDDHETPRLIMGREPSGQLRSK